ncbi:MAG: ribosome biogenesis GTP-binding protein YsxC [Myxococcales bacterium]|nr:ribosome biogenesis GTP-binding protein YsxC [Myxococcales bacterium]
MSFRIINPSFLIGAVREAQFPSDEATAEIVVAGRSNVGKSSLLNALFGTRKLVRVADRPGKTQELNFFSADLVNPADERRAVRFVDLPGYGYARVSKDQQREMSRRINRYLSAGRHRLAILLIDLKRGPSDQDLAAFDGLCDVGYAEVVITKSDQLARNKRRPALDALQMRMGLARPPLLTSSTKGIGISALTERLWSLTEDA